MASQCTLLLNLLVASEEALVRCDEVSKDGCPYKGDPKRSPDPFCHKMKQ